MKRYDDDDDDDQLMKMMDGSQQHSSIRQQQQSAARLSFVEQVSKMQGTRKRPLLSDVTYQPSRKPEDRCGGGAAYCGGATTGGPW